MTASDPTRRDRGARPGSYPPGSRRPREAPRPVRPSSSPQSTAIYLCPATFVELTGDQERHAVEALAELLVPLLIAKATGSTRVTAIDHTGEEATSVTSKTIDAEP